MKLHTYLSSLFFCYLGSPQRRGSHLYRRKRWVRSDWREREVEATELYRCICVEGVCGSGGHLRVADSTLLGFWSFLEKKKETEMCEVQRERERERERERWGGRQMWARGRDKWEKRKKVRKRMKCVVRLLKRLMNRKSECGAEQINRLIQCIVSGAWFPRQKLWWNTLIRYIDIDSSLYPCNSF